jgi:predicted TIM-barrel fold metal-dependent hydrolase
METTHTSVYSNLLTYADQIDIIDTHEHLPIESQRTTTQVDFSTLFGHYCVGDMVTAGLNADELKILQKPDAEIEIKWRVFAPYYELIKNGGYARSARIAMQKFYGIPDLTCLKDAIEVTEKMRKENTPGIYKRILQDVCRIKTVFLFTNDNFQTSYFNFVDCVDHLCHLTNLTELMKASSEIGGTHYTLQQYVDSLAEFLKQKVARNVKGVKFTCAYYRNLNFKQVPLAKAERIFNKLSSSQYLINDRLERSIDGSEATILQDYLTLRVLDYCEQLGLPAVFHTGLQAGNRNNPGNARPEPLWHLFYTYPKLNFVLLHGGLPWANETAMLAKSYPNVFMDMAWMHIISPEIAKNALKIWIDMVPKNKILGFGGDYFVPEKVYGHLSMAKENICHVLSEKMIDGALTETEACSWIEHLLQLNAVKVYGL